MAFGFTSVGGAMTRQMAEAVRERELQRRQEMLDQITQDRESRLERSDEANIAATQERIQTERAYRESLAEAAKARALGEDVKYAGDTYQIGDDVSKDPRVPAALRDDRRTSLPAKTMDIPASATGPGIVSQTLPAEGYERFKGTTAQRDMEAALADPNLTPNARIALRAKQAGLTSMPTAMFDEGTKPVVRASADKRGLEIFQNGSWAPVTGEIPKDAVMLQEPQPPQAVSINLGQGEGSALDLAAWQYLQTGQLPPGLGRNGVGQAAVLQRAAELAQQNGGINPQANASMYRAESAALTRTTQSLAAINAYENTARANIQNLERTIQAISDTGLPILNRPIREIQQMTGDTRITAFRTALGAVQPEIARILSNPNLTGVLSDSARQEAERLISGDMSVDQLRTALRVLSQDMANRKTSLIQEQQALQESLKGRGAPGVMTPPSPTPAAAPATPSGAPRRVYDPATRSVR